MNELKRIDFKCVQKATKSRLNLIHQAVEQTFNLSFILFVNL